jgi:hypothetical protein
VFVYSVNELRSAAFWQTLCVQNDKVVARVLHLMISGNESYYQIQKVWKMEVDTKMFAAWRERFEETYVYDLKHEDNRCPQH